MVSTAVAQERETAENLCCKGPPGWWGKGGSRRTVTKNVAPWSYLQNAGRQSLVQTGHLGISFLPSTTVQRDAGHAGWADWQESAELGSLLHPMWTEFNYSLLQMLPAGSSFDGPCGESLLWRKLTSSWQNNPEITISPDLIGKFCFHVMKKCVTSSPVWCNMLFSYEASELSLIVKFKLWLSKRLEYILCVSEALFCMFIYLLTCKDEPSGLPSY